MPQLFPMNWNFLCILFTVIMILFSMLMYFNKMPKMKILPPKKNDFQKNWKW
nr:ATP synthase F0 subunit 8 [Ornithodoros kalahariensis]